MCDWFFGDTVLGCSKRELDFDIQSYKTHGWMKWMRSGTFIYSDWLADMDLLHMSGYRNTAMFYATTLMHCNLQL